MSTQFSLQHGKLALHGTPRAHSSATIKQLLNAYLVVPAFSAPFPGWAGSSHIVAQGTVQRSSPWSIVMPVIRPGFVAAVFWNGTERRKLWRAVGEKLSYDVYAGEVFPANVAVTLEIWSVETSANPIVNAEWQIPIAALELPTDFVDNTGTGIQLATLCLTHDETPADLDEYLAKCNL